MRRRSMPPRRRSRAFEGRKLPAQYFSAARSSVSRRLSATSGSAWPAPTTAASSAASLRTDCFALAWEGDHLEAGDLVALVDRRVDSNRAAVPTAHQQRIGEAGAQRRQG